MIIAKLLGIESADYAARLGVSPQWARILARDPRNSRRVLLAVLQAAAEREQIELAVSGGGR